MLQLRCHSGIPWRPRLAGLALCALLPLASPAAALEFRAPEALTDNAVDDVAPEISGDRIVWQGAGIFLKQGDQPALRLNNSGQTPEVSPSHVLWIGSDGLDTELFLFDGSSITLPFPNDVNDERPRISDSNFVWLAFDGQDREVFARIDGTTLRLTDNDTDDLGVEIDGRRVVWSGLDAVGGDFEIFLFDGTDLQALIDSGAPIESAIQQITDNPCDDEDPELSGSLITWTGLDCEGQNDFEIFVYDGASIRNLTDNDLDDFRAPVSGNDVVWAGQGADRRDFEIFHWDGVRTRQLTDNDFDDIPSQVVDGKVVWSASDGNDDEIFFHDLAGAEPCCTQVTDNGGDDLTPRLSGTTVVWSGEDPTPENPLDPDFEIFIAVPEPGTGALVAALALLAALPGSRRLRR